MVKQSSKSVVRLHHVSRRIGKEEALWGQRDVLTRLF